MNQDRIKEIDQEIFKLKEEKKLLESNSETKQKVSGIYDIWDWVVTKNGLVIQIDSHDMNNLKYEDINRHATNDEIEKNKLDTIIKDLNIRKMYCRSGSGLMYYVDTFIQIGGFKHSSGGSVTREEIWDGDFDKIGIVLDCRNGKCVKISKEEFFDILMNRN